MVGEKHKLYRQSKGQVQTVDYGLDWTGLACTGLVESIVAGFMIDFNYVHCFPSTTSSILIQVGGSFSSNHLKSLIIIKTYKNRIMKVDAVASIETHAYEIHVHMYMLHVCTSFDHFLQKV